VLFLHGFGNDDSSVIARGTPPSAVVNENPAPVSPSVVAATVPEVKVDASVQWKGTFVTSCEASGVVKTRMTISDSSIAIEQDGKLFCSTQALSFADKSSLKVAGNLLNKADSRVVAAILDIGISALLSGPSIGFSLKNESGDLMMTPSSLQTDKDNTSSVNGC
jgi:hypothetical protein